MLFYHIYEGVVNLKLIWLQTQRTVNLLWRIKWHLVHEVVDFDQLIMPQLTLPDCVC